MSKMAKLKQVDLMNIRELLGQLILVHLLWWNIHGTVVILLSGRM